MKRIYLLFLCFAMISINGFVANAQRDTLIIRTSSQAISIEASNPQTTIEKDDWSSCCKIAGGVGLLLSLFCCFSKRKETVPETPESPVASASSPEEQPDRKEPSDEWMRFLYDIYWKNLKQAERQYYCKLSIVMAMEGVLFLAYIGLGIALVLGGMDSPKKGRLVALILGVIILGLVGFYFLKRLNETFIEHKNKIIEKRKSFFDRCMKKAYLDRKDATKQFSHPDEFKCKEYSCWLLAGMWGIAVVASVVAIFIGK